MMENKACNELLRNCLKPGYTGVSYAIRINNEIVASDSLGVIDQIHNEPITNDCTFNVCSISKMFCAMAVMQLVEKGLLSLEDKVADILPEFWMPDERYKEITVRMCLDHSSGLPGTQWKHFNLSEVGKVDYYKEVLHYFSKSHLKADPGEYSVYCNDGFTVAEMVVAKVSGMRYEDYILKNITEPIGAHSTRLSYTINPDYPLVSEGKKPKELLLVQGAGGITTNMIDLTKFGQLFLEENSIISEESKEIMRRKWGATFLKSDNNSLEYGLGWDTVCFFDEDYDLGDHVQIKGGNSMIFSSRMIVIPKYNAVLTIAETHDCGLDIHGVIMRMFAMIMEQRGVKITSFDVVEPEWKQKFDGIYLQPTGGMKVTLNHSFMTLQRKNGKGEWELMEVLNAKDGKWWNDKQEAYFFEEHNEDLYLLKQMKTKVIAMAMKAKDYPALNDVWKQRLNKTYIVNSASPFDLAVGQILAAITLKKLEEAEGILIVEGHYRKKDGFLSGPMRFPFVPMDDNCGKSFLRTPGGGSRDLIDPWFDETGVEVASYHYIASDLVEEYNEPVFPNGEVNQVYRLSNGLNEMIEIPEGHRVILLDKGFTLVWDSLNKEEFTPLKQGWMILV